MRPLVFVLLAGLSCAACDRPDPAKEREKREQEIEGIYLSATAAYLHGDFEESLQLYDKVRRLSPNDPRLPAAIAEVMLSQGRLSDALDQFRRAAELDPERGTNWSRIGFILAQKGQRDEARQALHKALELTGTDFNAMENLGELAQRDGKLDEAIAWLKKAAEHAPPPVRPALYLRMSQLLNQAGRGAEAVPLLEQGVVAAPAGELFVELGDLQVRTGDFPRALESYRQAARRMPRDPTLWELIAALQLRMDRPADAEASYRESLRIEDRAVVHVALARLQLARGNKAAAQTELDLALKSATGEEEREAVELAELLVTFGRKQDALQLLSVLAEEEELHGDVPLQTRLAALARDLGRRDLEAAACGRLRKRHPGAKCP